MRTDPRSLGVPGGWARTSAIAIAVAWALSCGAVLAPRNGDTLGVAADTAGVRLVEWAYDRWTVPWVQVRGSKSVLAPASHATFMALACRTADLERDRLARHLSAEECEHRMAAIRADQDSALIFRLHLETLDLAGADALARLRPPTVLSLEDDRGRRSLPLEVVRGPAVLLTTGGEVRRTYYHPPWLRSDRHGDVDAYGVADAAPATVAQHSLRFARRDPAGGGLVASKGTRWLRLRLAVGANEWVATWAFRPEEWR